LLTTLDLKGALVTLDAAGCQKAFAEQIRRTSSACSTMGMGK
jgi:predicted transposase YbfD/YdcC